MNDNSTRRHPNGASDSRGDRRARPAPTTEALELALQELEGPNCAGVSLLPSGLAAISTALPSVLKAGDHMLVTDSAYGPTRNYSEGVLKRFGVTTTYFDPLIGDGIAEHFRPNTRAVFVESAHRDQNGGPAARPCASTSASKRSRI